MIYDPRLKEIVGRCEGYDAKSSDLMTPSETVEFVDNRIAARQRLNGAAPAVLRIAIDLEAENQRLREALKEINNRCSSIGPGHGFGLSINIAGIASRALAPQEAPHG